jgi:ABC-type sugar transport system permease subunit
VEGSFFYNFCLLTGLQGIPKELYDVADVDGASP